MDIPGDSAPPGDAIGVTIHSTARDGEIGENPTVATKHEA